jgi:hypothetical protein
LRCPKNGILPFLGLGVFAARKPQGMETADILPAWRAHAIPLSQPDNNDSKK